MLKKITNKVLDDLNRSILKELCQDARISTTEIGRRVGLSAPAVADRIQKMEKQGFIKGYRTIVDFDKVGLTIKALITFKAITLTHSELATTEGKEEVFKSSSDGQVITYPQPC